MFIMALNSAHPFNHRWFNHISTKSEISKFFVAAKGFGFKTFRVSPECLRQSNSFVCSSWETKKESDSSCHVFYMPLKTKLKSQLSTTVHLIDSVMLQNSVFTITPISHDHNSMQGSKTLHTNSITTGIKSLNTQSLPRFFPWFAVWRSRHVAFEPN